MRAKTASGRAAKARNPTQPRPSRRGVASTSGANCSTAGPVPAGLLVSCTLSSSVVVRDVYTNMPKNTAARRNSAAVGARSQVQSMLAQEPRQASRHWAPTAAQGKHAGCRVPCEGSRGFVKSSCGSRAADRGWGEGGCWLGVAMDTTSPNSAHMQ